MDTGIETKPRASEIEFPLSDESSISLEKTGTQTRHIRDAEGMD